MPEKSAPSPAVHNITFCGMTGAIFMLLAAAFVLCTVSFATHSWMVEGEQFYLGLWQKVCLFDLEDIPGWLTTCRVLLTVGFFGIVLSCALAIVYMTANRSSKNVTLTSLAFVSFVTVVFIVIGVVVMGAKKDASDHLSWSYGLTILAAILTFVAALLTVLQIRRSNVSLCR